MGLALDPIAAMRAIISKYDITDDGVVTLDGRPTSTGDLVFLQHAIAAFEVLLQQMIDREARGETFE